MVYYVSYLNEFNILTIPLIETTLDYLDLSHPNSQSKLWACTL